PARPVRSARASRAVDPAARAPPWYQTPTASSCGSALLHSRSERRISLRYTGRPMSRRVWPVGLLMCLAVGCSGPPPKEPDGAQAAIATARAADAATYASDDLQAAQGFLEKYDQAVQQRDYRQALGDAIDARDRAYGAARQAALQKAA